MSRKDINDLLNLQRIEEKIFKFKQMYHPNLIANLSKEAYDLYSIRESIGNQLLEEIEKKENNFQKVKELISRKISEIERKLKKTTDLIENNLLRLRLEEWKAFL
jgi:hypothetical protein